jgi:hypothetical protein
VSTAQDHLEFPWHEVQYVSAGRQVLAGSTVQADAGGTSLGDSERVRASPFGRRFDVESVMPYKAGFAGM